MKMLIIKRVYYVPDCKRLQSIALARGFEVTLLECQGIWGAYSASWRANWLNLPTSDDEVWKHMAEFIEEDFSDED